MRRWAAALLVNIGAQILSRAVCELLKAPDYWTGFASGAIGVTATWIVLDEMKEFYL